MDAQPNPLPRLYMPDKRHIKEIVKYCGVRFRAAVQEMLKMDDTRALEATFSKEMASFHVLLVLNVLSVLF
jgi:hypothetical protein